MKCNKYSGFTLIEMMVTVAIIAILAAIVYPNYENYIVRANRAVGEGALLEVASRQEQYFATNTTYADALGLLGYTDVYYVDREGQQTAAASAIYQLSVGGVGVAPFTTYTLTATPRNYQTRDDECGNLTVTHRGVKGTSLSGDRCW